MNSWKLVAITAGMLVCLAAAGAMELSTHAGAVQFGKDDGNDQCWVRVRNRVRAQWDCSDAYAPALLGQWPPTVAGEPHWVLLQDNPAGNACDGGPLRLFAIQADGAVRAAQPLDFCGGQAPRIHKDSEGLRVTFPGGPVNRGKGRTPTEVWRFRDGAWVRSKS